MMKSPIFPNHLIPYAKKAFQWEKNVYLRIDKIFTMSEYLRQSFINDFELSPSKVINIGVGMNFEIPNIITNKNYETKEILFIGTDIIRKGGKNLIEAFNAVKLNHPTARLHIVGPRSVPDFLAHLPFGVEFHGFLSKNDVDKQKLFIDLMEKCSLFILPSLYEPFGIAVLEAMAYCMPVIATNRWAFPEMITPGITGELVEPNNIDELIEKIDFYLQNPDIMRDHGMAARKFVVEKYRWDKVVKKIVQETNESSDRNLPA